MEKNKIIIRNIYSGKSIVADRDIFKPKRLSDLIDVNGKRLSDSIPEIRGNETLVMAATIRHNGEDIEVWLVEDEKLPHYWVEISEDDVDYINEMYPKSQLRGDTKWE